MTRRIVCVAVALVLTFALAVPAAASTGGTLGGLVSNLVSALLDGLEWLFVPDKEFMLDFTESIQSRFDRKFGGVTSAVGYLKDRFSGLKAYRNIEGEFVTVFPRGSILYGIRVNWLGPLDEILPWLRFCMNGVAVFFTALFGYRKVMHLIQRG